MCFCPVYRDANDFKIVDPHVGQTVFLESDQGLHYLLLHLHPLEVSHDGRTSS